VFPVQVINALDAVPQELLRSPPGQWSTEWWLLAPTAARQASYGPLVLFALTLAVIVLTMLGVRLLYHRRVRRGPAWDCGFVRLDARMQDTAEGFGQPIRHVFEPFFLMSRELPTPFDTAPRYQVSVGDRIWRSAYEPLGLIVRTTADVLAGLQQGRISTYLLYSFATLIALLALVL
jgi:hydrogenase-4 component B